MPDSTFEVPKPINPFDSGSPQALHELMTSLLRQDGNGKILKVASPFFACTLGALCFLRDNYGLKFGAKDVLAAHNAKSFVNILLDSRVSEFCRIQLKGYLDFIAPIEDDLLDGTVVTQSALDAITEVCELLDQTYAKIFNSDPSDMNFELKFHVSE